MRLAFPLATAKFVFCGASATNIPIPNPRPSSCGAKSSSDAQPRSNTHYAHGARLHQLTPLNRSTELPR